MFGYFSLGEAENYRDYFQSLSKSIVGPEDPNWSGNYYVALLDARMESSRTKSHR